MKDCQWIRKNLTAYAENQLNNVDQAIFRQHLGICPGCQQHWTEYRELDWLLQDLPPEPVPEDLTKNIMAAIQPLAAERKAVVQRDELSWWEFAAKGLPLLITLFMLTAVSWVIYLGQKFGWQKTPSLIWWRVSGIWSDLWFKLDAWSSKLTQSFFTTWDAALRLPDNSAGTLAGGPQFLINLVTTYRDVIQIIVLAVVVWIIIAVVTAYFSSRIIFDHGEERI